jgi:RNA polymerase sigma-70 factor (ECF subfamily)
VLTEIGVAPEAALLRSCLNGDQNAWRVLHLRYYPIAAAFLRKLGVRDRDLEDACQEVFLETYRHLRSFRAQAELKTWLYRLCITQARRARRKARVVDALKRAVAWLPSDALVSSHAFDEARARHRIHAALERLPEKERVAFVLYEMEGLPGKEIAAILDCPEATVWRRLHYARKTFRAALGADPEA